MTAQQIEQFRSELKYIQSLNSLIENALPAWSDIALITDEREKALKGKTYQQWIATSKRISQLQHYLKTSVKAVERTKKRINDLTFEI